MATLRDQLMDMLKERHFDMQEPLDCDAPSFWCGYREGWTVAILTAIRSLDVHAIEQERTASSETIAKIRNQVLGVEEGPKPIPEGCGSRCNSEIVDRAFAIAAQDPKGSFS